MKRFFIWVALLLPSFVMADDPRNWQWKCSSNEIYGDCGSDPATGKVTSCNFKEFVGTEERVCTPPDKYRDKDGNYHFDGETGGRLVLPPSEKQPKNEKPPEGGKQPKEQGCFEFEGHRGRSYEEVCKAAGWNYIPPRTACNKDGSFANGKYLPPGNNAIWGVVYTSKCNKDDLEKAKQPEQKEPKKPNTNDGKQPKHEDGKQPKGEGQGDDKGEKQPKGEGSGDSSGDNGGKGSKGEGNGKGEGSGDSEGKGMFKGGAGSGQLGDVRVPKSRDGMGWKGDFFLRNPNQCPQDKTMNVLGRSMTFSYSKMCEFLDMLSPVIKAVFMFIAGMLVVKSIRAK